jgi:hypothetical protein
VELLFRLSVPESDSCDRYGMHFINSKSSVFCLLEICRGRPNFSDQFGTGPDATILAFLFKDDRVLALDPSPVFDMAAAAMTTECPYPSAEGHFSLPPSD